MTINDLELLKIDIIEGVNSSPRLPSATTGGNISLRDDRFNSLINLLSILIANFRAENDRNSPLSAIRNTVNTSDSVTTDILTFQDTRYLQEIRLGNVDTNAFFDFTVISGGNDTFTDFEERTVEDNTIVITYDNVPVNQDDILRMGVSDDNFTGVIVDVFTSVSPISSQTAGSFSADFSIQPSDQIILFTFDSPTIVSAIDYAFLDSPSDLEFLDSFGDVIQGEFEISEIGLRLSLFEPFEFANGDSLEVRNVSTQVIDTPVALVII